MFGSILYIMFIETVKTRLGNLGSHDWLVKYRNKQDKKEEVLEYLYSFDYKKEMSQ